MPVLRYAEWFKQHELTLSYFSLLALYRSTGVLVMKKIFAPAALAASSSVGHPASSSSGSAAQPVPATSNSDSAAQPLCNLSPCHDFTMACGLILDRACAVRGRVSCLEIEIRTQVGLVGVGSALQIGE